VARALIVGCGCRGAALGQRLAAEGWAVRGTTRRESELERIGAAGLEAVVADPDRPGTVLELVADVAVVVWLLGSASGEPEAAAALNGPRLERLLEKLVDTPVRGFAYEAAGTADRTAVDGGAEIVERAAATWRIPAAVLREPPGDWDRWSERTAARVVGLLA
jgi:nucleoside-diphosphate-sugar epimerase